MNIRDVIVTLNPQHRYTGEIEVLEDHRKIPATIGTVIAWMDFVLDGKDYRGVRIIDADGMGELLSVYNPERDRNLGFAGHIFAHTHTLIDDQSGGKRWVAKKPKTSGLTFFSDSEEDMQTWFIPDELVQEALNADWEEV